MVWAIAARRPDFTINTPIVNSKKVFLWHTICSAVLCSYSDAVGSAATLPHVGGFDGVGTSKTPLSGGPPRYRSYIVISVADS